MAYRFRMYPTPEQEVVMERYCADARYVYNLGLEQRNYWNRNRTQRVSFATQCKDLTQARESTWLGAGSRDIQEQALRDLDQAFQNWWKNPSSYGRPTWRRISLSEGFCVRYPSGRTLSRYWAEMLVPKLGYVKFKLSRTFSLLFGCKSARITKDHSGRWHISFTAPQPSINREPTGSALGVDLGLSRSITTSNGDYFDMPDLLSLGEKTHRRRLQRKMAKQQKGSNRRNRTRHSLARISARETDRRKDWLEKTTTRLVVENDFIAIEDLKVQKMTRSDGAKKRELNRQIQSQAWSTIRKRLQDKAAAAISPVEVVAVNPAFTSQRCNRCDHVDKKNRENQAIFACQNCGHTDNADVNAARNILAAGLAVTGRGGLCSKAVEPSTNRSLSDYSKLLI